MIRCGAVVQDSLESKTLGLLTAGIMQMVLEHWYAHTTKRFAIPYMRSFRPARLHRRRCQARDILLGKEPRALCVSPTCFLDFFARSRGPVRLWPNVSQDSKVSICCSYGYS